MSPDTNRRVIGLMSGTSLDGVDAALIHVSGTGRSLQVQTEGFISVPYPNALKDRLLENCSPGTSSVKEISQLNVRLAHIYADTVHSLVEQCSVSLDQVDAIGSHGQTIFHVPVEEDCAGLAVRSTLQIGDPSTLACLLQRTVVGDFRMADMAVGGQGAPLASYFDYMYFTDETEARALLNIGGIGNMTVLPPNAKPEDAIAFDTGPGNMIMDAVAHHFWDQPYDTNGQFALQGTVNRLLLGWMLSDPYYAMPPPKTTGRELYSVDYVNTFLHKAQQLGIKSRYDIIATATAFTAETIYLGYEQLIKPLLELDRIIVSGGGIHNACLLNMLRASLPSIQIERINAHGIDSDAKEAIFFAVLAHETLNGIPSNLPSATGASRPTILGKICIPA